MAHVLGPPQVKDDDFRTLVASFGAALGKVSGDDRSFAYSVTVGKEIQALVERVNAGTFRLCRCWRSIASTWWSTSPGPGAPTTI